MMKILANSSRRGTTSPWVNLVVVILSLGLAVGASYFALLQKKKVRLLEQHQAEEVAKQVQAAREARPDFLEALNLAESGSKTEALHLLAESLRIQPENNPAAGVAFQLLTQLRVNSSLMFRGHSDAVLYAAYNPDGTKIITCSSDHTARIWDARTGKELVPALHHDDDVLMADFSADGTKVVTASADHTARVWSAETGEPLSPPIKETDDVHCARFNPDGRLVATGSGDARAGIWNAQTGAPTIPQIKYHEDVFSVRFSRDGKRLLIASGDDKAEIIDVQTGQRLAVPMRHLNRCYVAIFSPTEDRILTASADHTARIWDGLTGKPTGPIFQHGFWVVDACFSTDGTRVATASWDHTGRVWDAQSGAPITPPLRHSDAVLGIALSPDGNRVATASRDHTARVWDATTGEPLTTLFHAGGEVAQVLFNKQGNSVVIVSKDHFVRVMDLSPEEKAPAWLADLAEFASTQTQYDQIRLETANEAPIKTLRERLLASRSDDPWDQFGRWYFADDSGKRGISPWSTVSLEDYVNEFIAKGDLDSVNYAASMAYDHPTWMVKIVPMQIKLKAQAVSAPAAPNNSKD